VFILQRVVPNHDRHVIEVWDFRRALLSPSASDPVFGFPLYLPHAGSRVERIDPLCFLAECRKRRLNQALPVLSLSIRFIQCAPIY